MPTFGLYVLLFIVFPLPSQSILSVVLPKFWLRQLTLQNTDQTPISQILKRAEPNITRPGPDHLGAQIIEMWKRSIAGALEAGSRAVSNATGNTNQTPNAKRRAQFQNPALLHNRDSTWLCSRSGYSALNSASVVCTTEKVETPTSYCVPVRSP